MRVFPVCKPLWPNMWGRRLAATSGLALALVSQSALGQDSWTTVAQNICNPVALEDRRRDVVALSDETGLTRRHGCLSQLFYVGSTMDTTRDICAHITQRKTAIDEIWITNRLRRYMRDRAVDHGCGDFPVDRDRLTLSTLRSSILEWLKAAHPGFLKEL